MKVAQVEGDRHGEDAPPERRIAGVHRRRTALHGGRLFTYRPKAGTTFNWYWKKDCTWRTLHRYLWEYGCGLKRAGSGPADKYSCPNDLNGLVRWAESWRSRPCRQSTGVSLRSGRRNPPTCGRKQKKNDLVMEKFHSVQWKSLKPELDFRPQVWGKFFSYGRYCSLVMGSHAEDQWAATKLTELLMTFRK